MATASTSKRDCRTNSDSRAQLRQSLWVALTSSVGCKFLMALTGLALTGFVIGHMSGNLLVFKGREALNDYAEFLKEHLGLLWLARGGLLVAFVLHLTLGIQLNRWNSAARPQAYVHEDTVQATWASRYMLRTGIIVLAFVIFHLLHYTFGVIAATAPDGKNFLDLTEILTPVAAKDPTHRHDVYAMTVYGFRNISVSMVYIVAQVFLGLHLDHGIASAFQSLGWNSPRWHPSITAISRTLAIVVILGNISMPLAVLTGWVGQDVPGTPPIPLFR